MALRRLVLAALLATASLAIVAGAVPGEIIVGPRDPPDGLEVELLELWEEGRDAAREFETPGGGGAACRECHSRLSPP